MMYGIAMNRNESITYGKSYAQMEKEAKATKAKFERIAELQENIDSIKAIYFKDRSDSLDAALVEYEVELTALVS